MNFSDHYDLNLVEGTDIVNPLIQDVPNYEKIDGQMYANACASVGIATELAGGGVHALTRENPDAAMFRFTATSDYKIGDTFTVDGIMVTAKIPTGETPGEGAYVINSTVLCCLVGTLLTLFVPSGTVEQAEDSKRLGGELPDHFATANSVTIVEGIANSAYTLSTSVRNDLDRITNIVEEETEVCLFKGKTLYRRIFEYKIVPNMPTSFDVPTPSANYDKMWLDGSLSCVYDDFNNVRSINFYRNASDFIDVDIENYKIHIFRPNVNTLTDWTFRFAILYTKE